jgi:hypothetical protein
MAYTNIIERNKRRYYYRVISVRKGDNVNKKRVYLGANLDENTLKKKEEEADKVLLMGEVDKSLERIKRTIMRILKKYHVKKAGIFGSYVRGEQTTKSDIDIIIDPPKGIGLKFVSIAFDLEEALHKKVDLLTYKGIHPLIKERVLKEEVRIL